MTNEDAASLATMRPLFQRIIWAVDGNRWTGRGRLGTYAIVERTVGDGSDFAVSFDSAGIGELSSLANAKLAAETYDSHHSNQ